MRAIEVHGFGGGFALAVRQSGFSIVAKREGPEGFALPMYQDNLGLLGTRDIQTAAAASWNPAPAEFVFGNPPCSGFSSLSVAVGRPGGSANLRNVKDNEGMRDLVQFAARCDPVVVVFESVVSAYSQGRALMSELRALLERETGGRFDLHHLLHNNLSTGGVSNRRRYFWVASRIAFGVDHPTLIRPLTLRERIGDLESIPLGGVPGHVVIDIPRSKRLSELASSTVWHQGELAGSAYQRAVASGVHLSSWNTERTGPDHGTGMHAAFRWRYDAPGFVLTGALAKNVHPVLPRVLTYREGARIMGYPDTWNLSATSTGRFKSEGYLGRGVPLESARWLAGWVYRSFAGEPGPLQGLSVGDREYLVDVRRPKVEDDQPALFAGG